MAKEKEIKDLIKYEGVDCKGFGIIAKLVMTDIDLKPGAKALYSYLCSYAGSGTSAYPSRSKILFDMEICQEAYYKHLHELLDNGYIRIQRANIYPFGNTYIIVSNPPKLAAMIEKRNKEEAIKGNDRLIVRGIKAFGYGTVPRSIMLDKRIHYKAKALYAYFCAFAGNGSTAFPKRDVVMNHMRMTINPFQKYLHQLIEYNYIEVEQQKNSGRFAGNIYYLIDMPDEEKGKEEMKRRADYQKSKAATSKKANKSQPEAVTKEEKKTSGNIATSSKNENQEAVEQDKPLVPVYKKTKQNQTEQEINLANEILQQRQIYSEIIKENIEYDILEENEQLKEDDQLIDLIFEIILDEVTSTKPTARINQREYPREIVKAQMLKLDYEKVEYVIIQLRDNTTEIKNFRQYILTALYNSNTAGFYISNKIKHDFPDM